MLLADVRVSLLLQSVAASAFLYFLGLLINRWYLSPLASFPGPKLASLTLWYEFYFDVVQKGQYGFEIGRMHKKYGPIVRISPHELHIDDPEYYDELYGNQSTRRDKYWWSYRALGTTVSTFGTLSHDLHRVRRAAVSPYFSKKSVYALEPSIKAVVDRLCSRLTDSRDTHKPVNLSYAYTALTVDIITNYAFGQPYGFIEDPDFRPQFLQAMEKISLGGHLNKQFGWFRPLMMSIPLWIVERLDPGNLELINMQKEIAANIQAIISGRQNSRKASTHPAIFEALMDSDLSPADKTLGRLTNEGTVIVAAGALTTAQHLRVTTYHVLANQPLLRKLQAELEIAIPDPTGLPPLTVLEQLPYLTAVMKEGLRMSYGVVSRLQRISPDQPTYYNRWLIPPGTPVGMTSIFMHDNPSIFPSPHTFMPERWLNEPTAPNGERLDRYLVPFGKGARQCLGMELARAEIYLVLAAVFRRFEMELFETARDEVDLQHDGFNPLSKRDGKGVRVVIMGKEGAGH